MSIFLGDPALQTHHTAGVPHVHDNGVISTAYDEDESRVQRILYHALVGTHHGADYSLAPVRDAGFTAIHFWEGQDQDRVAGPASAAGLALVPHWPTDSEVSAMAGRSGVLAWYLDEEPSFLPSEQPRDVQQASFLERRSRINDIDGGRPVFLLDGPPVERVIESWKSWAVLGDITVHDYYAVHEDLAAGLSPAARIAYSVTLARKLNSSDRPLWFTIQAFEAPARGWRMPSPRQYRAMAMAALIHGASGLVTFSLDSFVTRDDGVVGISPAPRSDYSATQEIPDYNVDGLVPAVADSGQLDRSRGLWGIVSSFNAFLSSMSPILLQPTVKHGLDVQATDSAGDLDAPIRAIAKTYRGDLYIFLVNLSVAPANARIRCDPKICRAGSPENVWPFDPARPSIDRGGAGVAWEESVPALGVRVYRLKTAEQTAWTKRFARNEG